jgi:glycolate oxidase FAD binding subunit
VTVRLYPRPAQTATVVGRSSDPTQLAAASAALGHAPLEADCLDLWWDGASGAVLVRFGSADPGPRAEEAAALFHKLGGLEVDIDTDDEACWEAQRAAQRGDVVVKVSTLPAALPAAMIATQTLGGTLVARAALGLVWIQLPGGETAAETVARIESLRESLPPAPCVVLDAPSDVRAALDPWGSETGPVDLMRKVKERFDPAGVCAPGLFVGGI